MKRSRCCRSDQPTAVPLQLRRRDFDNCHRPVTSTSSYPCLPTPYSYHLPSPPHACGPKKRGIVLTFINGIKNSTGELQRVRRQTQCTHAACSYTMRVYCGDIEIVGSPVSISLEAAAAAATNTRVYGSGLTEAVTEHQVGRDPSRFLAIRRTVPAGGSLPARRSCVPTYECRHSPSVPVSASVCRSLGADVRRVACMQAEFIIAAYDRYGNMLSDGGAWCARPLLSFLKPEGKTDGFSTCRGWPIGPLRACTVGSQRVRAMAQLHGDDRGGGSDPGCRARPGKWAVQSDVHSVLTR